jgi:hypothetical protein
VSGAVFLLPFQLSVLGVPSPAVTATNLLYNVISVPGGLWRFSRAGSLHSPITRWILAGTVPGVVGGALVRVFVLPDGTVFRFLLALLLVPLGAWLLLRRPAPQRPAGRWPSTALIVSLGLGAGLVGGVYGIGGGALLAPVLVGLGLSALVVAPATLTATFVTSCVGAGTFIVLDILGHPQAGPDWSIAVACGIGGLVGGYLGAVAQPHVPQGLLSRGLGVVSIAVAISYLLAVLG